MAEIRPYRAVIYSEARRLILGGDVLLHRPTKHLMSRLIGEHGGGPIPYSHAALAAWWGDIAFLLETLQWAGAHAVTLSSQVEQNPGHYDVYRVRPPYAAAAAVDEMLRITGTPYGWRSLGMAALRHVPILKHLVGRTNPKWPPMCSQAVGRACRAGRADPLPGRDEAEIEPWQLGVPEFAEYQFTLFWSAGQMPLEPMRSESVQ